MPVTLHSVKAPTSVSSLPQKKTVALHPTRIAAGQPLSSTSEGAVAVQPLPAATQPKIERKAPVVVVGKAAPPKQPPHPQSAPRVRPAAQSLAAKSRQPARVPTKGRVTIAAKQSVIAPAKQKGNNKLIKYMAALTNVADSLGKLIKSRSCTFEQQQISASAHLSDTTIDAIDGHAMADRLHSCQRWESPLPVLHLTAPDQLVTSEPRASLYEFDLHHAFPGFDAASLVPVANATTEMDARATMLRLGIPPLLIPDGHFLLSSDRNSTGTASPMPEHTLTA